MRTDKPLNMGQLKQVPGQFAEIVLGPGSRLLSANASRLSLSP
jgi:hypothetical protein